MIFAKLEKRKILLVEPPFDRLFKDTYSLQRYPLSLGYLGGEIRKRTSWDVMAYNADFFPESETVKLGYLTGVGFDNYLHNLKESSGQIWREVESVIAEYGPSIIGISAKSQNFASALVVAKLAKKIDKNTIVIMGGPHPTLIGTELLDHQDVDMSVFGEGEKTIIELLNAFDGHGDLHSIPGIIFRHDAQIVKTSPREFISDLDELCFPHEFAAEILKDYDKYPKSAFENIFSIRGCRYDCSFCGSRYVWSRKVRFRSPENVIQEIKGLQRMGLNYVRFDDDTFGVDRKHIHGLCNAIKLHCPELKWSCELHVKLVDEQNIAMLKSAGCISIQVGIESGNNDILRAIRKNITIEEALQACELINRSGIMLSVFFMVGFPQETEDSLRDTINAMKKVKCYNVCYNIYTPYPGTETFDFCMREGLISDNYDVSLYNHQSPKNHFCINIPPEKFRKLLKGVERSIDRKNLVNRIKGWFSLAMCKEIARSGIVNSLKKGFKILAGR